MRKRNSNAASSGMTLIEVMIAVGLSSAVALGVGTYLSQTSTGMNFQKATRSRDEIASKVRSLVTQSKALQYTARDVATNPLFNQCVLGTCASGSAGGVSIISPGPIGAPTEYVSGPPGNTRHYTIDGRPCAATESITVCPIEVETTFTYVAGCY